MVGQRAIANHMSWMQGEYELDSSDRVLQKTPCGFDVSVWEFFWPLLEGAALVVARPAGHKDAAYLAEIIARARITTLHFVPSMLECVFAGRGSTVQHPLKTYLCSGEALPAELQERFFTTLDVPLHELLWTDRSSRSCQASGHVFLVRREPFR